MRMMEPLVDPKTVDTEETLTPEKPDNQLGELKDSIFLKIIATKPNNKFQCAQD